MNPEKYDQSLSNHEPSEQLLLISALDTVYWLDCLRFPQSHSLEERRTLEDDAMPSSINPMFDPKLNLRDKAAWIAQAITDVRNYIKIPPAQLRQYIIDVNNESLDERAVETSHRAEDVMPTLPEWLALFEGPRKSKLSKEKLLDWLEKTLSSAA